MSNMNPPPYAIPTIGIPLAKVGPHPRHEFLPRGEPLDNFGFLGMIYTNYGRAPLRRDLPNMKPSLHATPSRGGVPSKNWAKARTQIPH